MYISQICEYLTSSSNLSSIFKLFCTFQCFLSSCILLHRFVFCSWTFRLFHYVFFHVIFCFVIVLFISSLYYSLGLFHMMSMFSHSKLLYLTLKISIFSVLILHIPQVFFCFLMNLRWHMFWKIWKNILPFSCIMWYLITTAFYFEVWCYICFFFWLWFKFLFLNPILFSTHFCIFAVLLQGCLTYVGHTIHFVAAENQDQVGQYLSLYKSGAPNAARYCNGRKYWQLYQVAGVGWNFWTCLNRLST